MNKLIAVLSILIIANTAISQTYPVCEDCYWGFEAGGVLSTVSGLDGSTMKPGFHGAIYSYKPIIYDVLDLRTGLALSGLGAKISGYDEALKFNFFRAILTLHYRPAFQYQFFGELNLECLMDLKIQ